MLSQVSAERNRYMSEAHRDSPSRLEMTQEQHDELLEELRAQSRYYNADEYNDLMHCRKVGNVMGMQVEIGWRLRALP